MSPQNFIVFGAHSALPTKKEKVGDVAENYNFQRMPLCPNEADFHLLIYGGSTKSGHILRHPSSQPQELENYKPLF
jgi:hypothetical protein